mmetsp:Transcript_28607/g.36968  ORF Transcript_28607/g.36968 Transcript_28607/m.36968 type:complete len:102 (-) Transcript_28607:181-486(-)
MFIIKYIKRGKLCSYINEEKQLIASMKNLLASSLKFENNLPYLYITIINQLLKVINLIKQQLKENNFFFLFCIYIYMCFFFGLSFFFFSKKFFVPRIDFIN